MTQRSSKSGILCSFSLTGMHRLVIFCAIIDIMGAQYHLPMNYYLQCIMKHILYSVYLEANLRYWFPTNLLYILFTWVALHKCTQSNFVMLSTCSQFVFTSLLVLLWPKEWNWYAAFLGNLRQNWMNCQGNTVIVGWDSNVLYVSCREKPQTTIQTYSHHTSNSYKK